MKRQHDVTTQSLHELSFWCALIPTPARHFKSLVAGLIFVWPLLSGAAPTYFFNDPITARSAFQAAASGPRTLESFEQEFPTGLSASFPVGGAEAFTVSSSTVGRPIWQEGANGRAITDGSFALGFDEYPPGVTLTFSFDQPIHAFGLDVNDLNFASMSFADNLGNVKTRALLGDNGSPAGGPGFQNVQFFGVVNTTAFSQVQLTFGNPTALTGIICLDRLEYTPVPEPATFAMAALGALALMFHFRCLIRR